MSAVRRGFHVNFTLNASSNNMSSAADSAWLCCCAACSRVRRLGGGDTCVPLPLALPLPLPLPPAAEERRGGDDGGARVDRPPRLLGGLSASSCTRTRTHPTRTNDAGA